MNIIVRNTSSWNLKLHSLSHFTRHYSRREIIFPSREEEEKCVVVPRYHRNVDTALLQNSDRNLSSKSANCERKTRAPRMRRKQGIFRKITRRAVRNGIH